MSIMPQSAYAELAVLNVGEGDMKFSFDADDVQEVARAERIVTDMLRRGYALFAEVNGKLVRLKSFDAKTASYIVADGPTAAAQPVEVEEVGEVPEPEVEPTKKKRGRPTKTEVPMKGTKVTSVPRTAGG